jgi:DNA ligase-associated metallophosphoesterase
VSGTIVQAIGAAELRLDPSGAVWWPRHRLLIVADLHLEKGSAFARRGALLPPYDTHATLARLEALVARAAPRMIVSLGDAFHDGRAAETLDESAARRLRRLIGAVRWVWVAGNHDPRPPPGLGGEALPELVIDGLRLRHLPDGGDDPEITGHLHPKARMVGAGRSLTRPCFVGDGRRLVLPAFGAFTGGLNVLDPAIASLFARGFSAWLLGEARVFEVPHDRLVRDPPGRARR